MEKLHEPHLIVQWFNLLFGRIVESLRLALHFSPTPPGHDVIPDYLVMCVLIVLGFTVLGVVIRSRLSVENPSRLQIVLEDLVSGVVGMLEGFIGARGREFLPVVGALGAFILAGNYLGLVPGFMAPTSNINVCVACAIVGWVYYNLHGIRTQGVFGYIKHFFGPAGVPVFMRPLMFIIELISHAARLLSLSLRLFGNIFGEELVIMILGTLIPFLIPLPMMALGLVTGGLQAYIFVLLTAIYLQGAVAIEHHNDQGARAHDPAELAVPA